MSELRIQKFIQVLIAYNFAYAPKTTNENSKIFTVLWRKKVKKILGESGQNSSLRTKPSIALFLGTTMHLYFLSRNHPIHFLSVEYKQVE